MNLEFRVWSIQGKSFYSERYLKHYNVTIPYNGEYIYQTFLGGEKKVGEDVFLQQWTGALDKNQQKIFEGDIVFWSNPDPYDNEELVTRIVGYNRRTMGFRLYKFPEQVGKEAGSSFFPEDVEVIGNIFEGAIKDGVNYGEYLKEK